MDRSPARRLVHGGIERMLLELMKVDVGVVMKVDLGVVMQRMGALSQYRSLCSEAGGLNAVKMLP